MDKKVAAALKDQLKARKRPRGLRSKVLGSPYWRQLHSSGYRYMDRSL